MKDLEQLEKKNLNLQINKAPSSSIQLKKKHFAQGPPMTGEKRAAINYEDKIRELENKLFGK